MVERVGERKDAAPAGPAIGRLEPNDAAIGGRSADGAAGVGSHGCGAKAGGDGDRRPARRSRWIVRRIPRIACRREGQAEIGAANREFVGLVLTEQNGTGIAQPYPALRILLRHMMLVTPRARGGADAAGLVDVLEADRDAVQWSARAARGDFSRGGACGIMQYRDMAVQ